MISLRFAQLHLFFILGLIEGFDKEIDFVILFICDRNGVV